ncbi:hypothetical protein IEO21_02416 [Rhodonia placenta]|uniref:Uncharacterized protein n=1 Tax=Rhodonia placenta TaxID=104341 RepID=A0A8H7P8B6_9APHY|nr:hypothetical protein IEO21_02416 [Postia placenta]
MCNTTDGGPARTRTTPRQLGVPPRSLTAAQCAPEKISPSRRARDGARPRASAYTGAIEFSAARTAEPNNVRTFPVSARRAHLFNGGGHASYASEVRCAATTPRCERAFQFQFDDDAEYEQPSPTSISTSSEAKKGATKPEAGGRATQDGIDKAQT